MRKRTFIDANVLMAACKGAGELGERALAILEDPSRTIVVSDAIRLEVRPLPRYHKREEELAFYDAVFDFAEHVKWCEQTLYRAHDIAEKYGIAAMDAIHVATALDAGASELVTAEKTTKPMFRVTELRVISIQ